MTIKKALILDAVTGKKRDISTEENVEITTETILKKGNKLRQNNLNRFLDDIIFLKYLGSISYFDTQTIKPQELHSTILRDTKYIDIYSNIIHN